MINVIVCAAAHYRMPNEAGFFIFGIVCVAFVLCISLNKKKILCFSRFIAALLYFVLCTYWLRCLKPFNSILMCLLDVANENKLVHRKRVLGQQQHLWLGHSGQYRRYLNGLRQSKHVNFATSHAVHRPPRHSVIREIAKSSQSTRSRRNILIAVRASNANRVGHFVRVCDRSFAHFTFWRANKQCGQLTKDYYIYPYVYTIAWRARASMRRSKRINTALCGQSAHTHASLWYSVLSQFIFGRGRACTWLAYQIDCCHQVLLILRCANICRWDTKTKISCIAIHQRSIDSAGRGICKSSWTFSE